MDLLWTLSSAPRRAGWFFFFAGDPFAKKLSLSSSLSVGSFSMFGEQCFYKLCRRCVGGSVAMNHL